jgi:hypothetical protein
MRTKVLLATAALTAGAFVASADVYSVNTVGYINLTLTPGYKHVFKHLTNRNKNNKVFHTNGVVDSMQISTLTGSGFDAADQYYDGFGWYDADFNPSTRIFEPGKGYMIFNPNAGNVTVTLVGDVPQGTWGTTIGSGNGLYGSIPPVVSGFSTNGFPAVDSIQYSTFTGSPTPQYSSAYQYYAGFGWYDGDFNPVDPAPSVGQGFLVFNPSAPATWTRSFTVQ